MFCQVYICWRKPFLKQAASEEDSLVCRACEHRDCWIEITGSEGCENPKEPQFHNAEGKKKEEHEEGVVVWVFFFLNFLLLFNFLIGCLVTGLAEVVRGRKCVL